MTESNLSLTLDPKDVERAIDASIKTQVAVALSANGDELIEALARSVISGHVDSEGNPCERGRYRSKTFIDYSVTGMIRKAVREEVVAWVEENRPKIRKMVGKKLIGEGGKNLAESMAAGMLDAMSNRWSFSVKLHRTED